jgi:hypothetical protein
MKMKILSLSVLAGIAVLTDAADFDKMTTRQRRHLRQLKDLVRPFVGDETPFGPQDGGNANWDDLEPGRPPSNRQLSEIEEKEIADSTISFSLHH